jgi:hypothetical protein
VGQGGFSWLFASKLVLVIQTGSGAGTGKALPGVLKGLENEDHFLRRLSINLEKGAL